MKHLDRTLLLVAVAFVFVLSGPALAAGQEVVPDRDLSADPEARSFAEMLFGQGRLAWEDGDLASALMRFDRAAATYPKDATYSFFAGLVEMKMGRPARAAEKIMKALPPAESRLPEWRVRSELGAALYLDGRASEAEKDLRRALELRPTDAPTRFTLGLVLLDLDRPDEAATAFEAARKGDPSLEGDAHYYSGVAALRRGDESVARAELREVVSSAGTATGKARPAPELVLRARGWLGGVPEAGGGGAPPRGELRIGAAWEWDGNPTILSEDLKLVLPKTPGRDGDHRTVGSFRAEWHPFYGWHALSMGLLLRGYRAAYNNLDELDQWTPEALVQLAWGRDSRGFVNGPLGYVRVPSGESNVRFVLQGGGSRTWLNGDRFSRQGVIAGGASAPWSEWTTTQLDTIYRETTYFGDLSGRSNDTWSARLSEYVHLGRPDRYVRVGYEYADENADGTVVLGPSGLILDKDTYDNKEDGWFAELAWTLPKNVALFLDASRSKTDYDAPFPITSTLLLDRQDTQTNWSGSVAVGVSRHVYVTGGYSRQKRESNIEPLGYRREIVSVGATLYW